MTLASHGTNGNLCDQQRHDALQKANEVRIRRHEWKVALKRGTATLSLREAVLDTPGWLLSMKVSAALEAQHRWGAKKANRALRVAGCSRVKTFGDLSDRQRVHLAAVLPASKEKAS